jgi:hypothetical protein
LPVETVPPFVEDAATAEAMAFRDGLIMDWLWLKLSAVQS